MDSTDTTFAVAKAMGRLLTKAEDAEIIAYWEANQNLGVGAVIERFEKKFKTPITKHHVLAVMMSTVP